MPSPNRRFEILNEFRGYGNPKARLWFVGLEGAGSWNADYQLDEEKYKKYSLGCFPFAPGEIQLDAKQYGQSYTKVYDIMSKFATVASTGSASALSRWVNYRDQHLLLEGDDTFQANLYPLGKRAMNHWPLYYEELFNIHSQQEYYKEVRGQRFAMLRAFHIKQQPSLTICFGRASAGGDFERLFDLDHGFQELDGCRFYPNRLVLCPFFVPSHMSDDRIVSCALHCVKKYPGLW